MQEYTLMFSCHTFKLYGDGRFLVFTLFIYLLGLSFWSRTDIFNGVVTNDGVREGGG